MNTRPKHLPMVEGFDEEEAVANSSPDAMVDGMQNPFEKLAGREPSQPSREDDLTSPATGGMSALGPADKGDLDNAIGSKLSSQPPPPPPGSQASQGGPGAPPPMPGGMSRHYDDEQADQRDVDAGRERDDESRMLRGLEMAGRQLVSGVLRQPMAESVNQPTNYEQEATARAERNRQSRRTGDLDERNFGVADGQRKITLAHQGAMDAKAETARVRELERDKKGDEEKDEDQGIRKEQNAAMLALAGANLGIAKEGAGIRRGEADDKARERSDKDSARTFDYDGGKFVIKQGLSSGEDGKAREIGGLYGSAFNALDGLKPKLQAIITAKTPDGVANARSELAGSVQAAATASNAALGQGAMAENEKRAMYEAMGADVMSLDGARAFVSGDPAALSRRLGAFRNIVASSAKGRLSPYGEIQGRQSAGGGLVSVTNKKTGKTKQMNAADAAPFKGDPDFEVR